MEKQQGKIIYVDSQQFQKSVDSDGLRYFLTDQRVQAPRSFLDQAASVFQNGSSNRSFFFANIAVTNSYGIPCYGVKGSVPNLSRSTNYTELLVASEEDLQGTGFNRIVFGSNLLKPNESAGLTEDRLKAIIERKYESVSRAIPEENRKAAAMTVEKLWEAQEQDPNTRFVIRLKNAETRSLELIREVYTFLPQRLRQQLGFETNVNALDLIAMKNNGGFPIYVMTAEEGEDLKAGQFDFPVVYFDYDRRDSYSYNQNRLQNLIEIAGDDDPLREVLFDYAEKKVCEQQHVKYSSFKFYEAIAEKRLSKTDYWWRNPNIESIEALKAAYEDQAELLNNDTLKQEATSEFLTKILPNSALLVKIAQIALNSSYPNQKELLNFLKTELHQESQIKAFKHIAASCTESFNKKIDAQAVKYQNEIQSLKDAHEKELEEADQLHENDMREMKAEIERLKNRESVADGDEELYDEYEEFASGRKSSPSSKSGKSARQKKAAAARRKKEAQKRRIIIIGAAAALLIVIAIVIFVFVKPFGGKKDAASSAASSTVSSTAVTAEAPAETPTETPAPVVTEEPNLGEEADTPAGALQQEQGNAAEEETVGDNGTGEEDGLEGEYEPA